MRLIALLISFGVAFMTTVKSQPIQPKYLGEALWRKVSHQQDKQLLDITAKSFPITKTTAKDSPLAMVQEKIDPETITLHYGPTLPVIQKFFITGKKLLPPKVFPAPPLLTRETAGFNISYADKRHGFPAVITTDFAEDNAHNIWMATDNGVIRYDGNQYYVYDQSSGLPDMTEASLVYDNQKRLWVVSGNGAYFIRNDSLFNIHSQEIDFSKLIGTKVGTDRLNRVWIPTLSNGVICIDGSTIQIFDKRCGLPTNLFHTVYMDKKGNLYLGSNGSGLILIEPDRMRMFFSKSKKMQTHTFISIYEDEDGIWAGAHFSGLMHMGPKDTTRNSIDGKFNERIYGMKKTARGMWISCFSKALCYFDKKNLFVINQNNGLVSNFPYMIFEDSYQNLWVSSGSSGFSRVNETSFYQQTYSNPIIGFVNRIIPDHKNGHWLTTYGRGLINHKGNAATSYNFTEKNQPGSNPLQYINDALVDNNGWLWIANYSMGIIRLTEREFTVFNGTSSAQDLTSLVVKQDSVNRLWLFGKSGLIQYDYNRFWQYTEKSGLLNNNVTNLFLDAGKKIHWSFAEGFQRFNGLDMETFYIGNQQFKDKVNGMLALDRDINLMATTINGLLLIHKGKVYQFSMANGFTSNSINMMIQDTTGKIWITTEKGIESFRVKGVSVTEHRIFNVYDGPYIMDVKYAMLDTTGLPFWSERENKLVFDPSFLKTKTGAPLFSFDRIQSNHKIVSANETISILPDQKINIDYKTIYWGRENNLKLSYLLISDKSDTTERSVENKGSIIISDVQAGTYRLLLKASDNDKFFYSHPLTITVKNFWYNTGLFRLLMICLLVTGIVIYFRQKAARQKAMNKILERKVAEQTKEIIKEKEELEKSNKIIDAQVREKDVLIQEINHRVKNNLQFMTAMVEMQIRASGKKDTTRSLMETNRRINAMSLVHEMLYDNTKKIQGLSIKKYITELIDNLKEMASGDEHPISINMAVADLFMDSRSAVSLGMIISELVSNSFKHAFAGIDSPEINIELVPIGENGYLRLTVSDNGTGVKQEKVSGTGLGRKFVDIFSRQLDGTYTIQTDGHFTYVLQFKIFDT